jgi:L-ribulokinase
MTGVKDRVYTPVPEHVAVYRKLYEVYTMLHDAFGTRDFRGSLHSVMKELLLIKAAARRG